MINYTLKVYFKTGITSSNIYYNPASVDSHARSQVITDMASRMLLSPVMQVQIGDVMDFVKAQEIDYAKITYQSNDYYYFVDGVEPLAASGFVLTMSVDALSTLNCLSKNTVTGNVSRRLLSYEEVNDYDAAVKKTLNEPFQPMYAKVYDSHHSIVGFTDLTANLVSATVDLRKISYEAKDYIDKKTFNFVTVPKLPPMDEYTNFFVKGLNNGGNFSSAGLSLFNGRDEKIKKGIDDARSLGVESAVQASYNLPAVYGIQDDLDAQFISLVSSEVKTTTADIELEPVKVENKKALTLNQTVTLMSLVSGDQQTYSLNQLNSDFTFKYWSDPRPDGNPFCRPASIQGDNNVMYGAVVGAQWTTQPIGFEQMSGLAVAQRRYRTGLIENWASAPGKIMSGAASSGMQGAKVGGVKGAVAGAVGGAVEETVGALWGLRKNKLAFEEQTQLSPPEIAFAIAPGMQNFIGNDFSVIRERLSDRDIKAFDKFLHNYGESVNEVYEQNMLLTRPNFNYIQFSDVEVLEGQSWLIVLAEAALQGGTRVWHNKINKASLKVGGNK